jgi:hypothetical protein
LVFGIKKVGVVVAGCETSSAAPIILT